VVLAARCAGAPFRRNESFAELDDQEDELQEEFPSTLSSPTGLRPPHVPQLDELIDGRQTAGATGQFSGFRQTGGFPLIHEKFKYVLKGATHG